MADPVELPYIDEHEITIAAAADDVWTAIGAALDGAFASPSSSRYAGLVGCVPRGAAGPRPFAEGSTIPGFAAVRAVPGAELALEGRHRFSTYSLTFRLDPIDAGHTRLHAESRATFPGIGGSIYHALVISTRGHRVAVRRLLSGIRRHAEAG